MNLSMVDCTLIAFAKTLSDYGEDFCLKIESNDLYLEKSIIRVH